MPLYEYQCEACEHRFEVIQKYSDSPPAVCPTCGRGPVRQLLSSPAIQFKGSGWYITDYAKKGKAGESSEAPKADGKKPDAAPAEASTKSDTPAATPDSTATKTKD